VSVYKPKRSPYWAFDFEIAGDRFHGSTKATTRRAAEAVERAERAKVEALVAQEKAAGSSLRLDDVAGRYWDEVGQHHAGAANTEKQLERLIEFFGADKPISEITGDDVAKLVAWRRGHRIERGGKIGALVGPFTVNDTVEQLRKLFTRAKTLGVRFDREPRWKDHWLKEPQERKRELVGDERQRLEAATRDDYAPFFAFAHATGLRLNECLLRWSEVNWGERQIVKIGKGGAHVTTPITSAVREILWPLRGHHPDFVFTFVAARTLKGRGLVKGERYPIAYQGVKTAWRRLRADAGVTTFRFHDFRHNVGTKLLRETGNLKLVQRALNHADLKTTARYAHVFDEDVAEALERFGEARQRIAGQGAEGVPESRSESRSDAEIEEKSRNESRNGGRKTA
jgi:integrase